MIFFNVAVGFVGSLTTPSGDPVFPVAGDMGINSNVSEGTILANVTGLDNPNMANLWLSVVGLGFLGAVTLAFLTKSVIPIGIHLFSTVFWTAYIKSNSILSAGDFIPGDFLAIFLIGMIFLFIAALVGMLTGSG
jgi:hypothetical protein